MTATKKAAKPAKTIEPRGSHDRIRVQGARVNNLRDISVGLPKRRLTVFTGVSGSGKSSLAFGTIAAESQRLINETYSAFLQGIMPTLARPEVDVLEGLTTAIIVEQERLGANARSTVGTVNDANAMLRILFSRLGQPQIGPSSALAFNVPSMRAVGGERGRARRRPRRWPHRLRGHTRRAGQGAVDADGAEFGGMGEGMSGTPQAARPSEPRRLTAPFE